MNSRRLIDRLARGEETLQDTTFQFTCCSAIGWCDPGREWVKSGRRSGRCDRSITSESWGNCCSAVVRREPPAEQDRALQL